MSFLSCPFWQKVRTFYLRSGGFGLWLKIKTPPLRSGDFTCMQISPLVKYCQNQTKKPWFTINSATDLINMILSCSVSVSPFISALGSYLQYSRAIILIVNSFNPNIDFSLLVHIKVLLLQNASWVLRIYLIHSCLDLTFRHWFYQSLLILYINISPLCLTSSPAILKPLQPKES